MQGLIVLGDSAPCEASLEDRVEVKAESVPCQVTQEHGVGGTERTDTEMGLWKGWGPGRPVNGVLNSLLPSCSPDGSEADDQLGKKLLAPPPSSSSSLPSSSSPSDASCTAARTRAVLNCKRRRLVRPNAVTNLNRKAQRLPAPRCSCEVNPSCLMCSGRPASLTGDLPYERPLLDRLSYIDPCIHPILSFSDDVAMTQHLQGALKTHWLSRPLEKLKPLKKFSLKQKLSGRLSDPSSSYSSSSKDKHRLPNSLITTIRLSHHNKLRLQQRQPFDSLLSASKLRKDRSRALSRGPHDRPHSRKRPRDSSLDRVEPSKLYPDSCSPCSSTSLHTPIHSPLLRQLSTSSESSMPFSLSGQNAISTPQPIRRRRGESSFDINNIVIPMSVAATTRVEKLQYKEILTPSWREVNICARPISKEDDAREVEDLSDVAFAEIHQVCEDQERARWSWTASAMAKRRGSRSYKSLDGRSTPLLGGTNPPTPQPSSPDPGQFPLLQDYGPVASPCSPASPDLLPPHHHRLSISEDTRCSTPEGGYEELIPQPVQPWETRTFPLDYDPLTEPQEPACPPTERLGHAPRRVSISKPDPAPASPDSAPNPSPEEGPRQKTPLFLLRSALQ
ncbi:hypothetical protein GJAV_G00225580 [Gymnothorax javanicus]|nr:hypothetical protein GJAV_G00225580 [Gymnothorax javanicus]